MNKVVHFEVPADDLARAKEFYSNVFSWQLQDVPEASYVMANTVHVDPVTYKPTEVGINGGMLLRNEHVKSPVITIEVESIDDHLKKIEEAGGKVVAPKTSVMDMGFSAYIKDTEGNIIGLWENKPQT